MWRRRIRIGNRVLILTNRGQEKDMECRLGEQALALHLPGELDHNPGPLKAAAGTLSADDKRLFQR
jgi:hypothetical protein